ncbi:glycosyltransferase [Subtercola endophyticus]|uniref:glycosyltransferase n=1 Tax=Subtercola endophyticus TaxID=2895559 RepID=UPI001E4A07F8|nr:glycosyltransferase [Subtercola endophyticus]UFS57736.1 glycosyltransferase [Subtercola endophyticus]
MRLFVDLSSTQDPISAERGIPTYAREFARAIEKAEPELVTAYGIENEGPLPAGLDFLLPTGKLQRIRNGRLGIHGTNDFVFDVWHDLSPFYDLSSEYFRFITESRSKLVVTLYDLIPLIFDDVYLSKIEVRANYYRSLSIVQQADKVMCISQSAADDGIRLLGLDPDKVFVVGTGVEARYQPTDDRAGAYRKAARGVKGLREGFVLYTGGIDHRKNIEGLLEAFSLVPRELRAAHQLVVVCRVTKETKKYLHTLAARLGILDDILFTGFVSSEHLLELSQSAHLFVFPSLYEGFGLPAAEAMMCHTPCIVGDNSSLVEVMPLADARFNAEDPSDIARAIVRGITDEPFRQRLIDVAQQSDFSWKAVAEKALPIYHSLENFTSPGPAVVDPDARQRIALVSPMPPTQSGVADYSARLLDEFVKVADVDVFTQADADRPELPGVRWFQYSAYPFVTTLDGPYNDTIFCMGNSTFHYPVLDLLRREQRGTVMQHDVNIQDMLMVAHRLQPDLVSRQNLDTLHRRNAGQLPENLQHYRAHDASSYYTYNSPMSAEPLAFSDDFIVHNISAATLARLESAQEEAAKIRVIPFGHRAVDAQSIDGPRDAVVSMGILAGRKRSIVIARAFALLAPIFPDLTFALVGESLLGDEGQQQLDEIIAEADLGDQLVITGRTSDSEYDEWLRRAKVAVQLRERSFGESSAAIADCFSFGAPVVASNVGPVRELPDDALLKVAPEIGAVDLAAVLAELLTDRQRLQSMHRAAIDHAEKNSFARAAEAVLDKSLGQHPLLEELQRAY